jgi:hypothetical protein
MLKTCRNESALNNSFDIEEADPHGLSVSEAMQVPKSPSNMFSFYAHVEQKHQVGLIQMMWTDLFSPQSL